MSRALDTSTSSNGTDLASDGQTFRTQDGLPRDRKSNAATGASAAGIRALSAQFVAFYFRAPMKAFFRTRVDYMGMSNILNHMIHLFPSQLNCLRSWEDQQLTRHHSIRPRHQSQDQSRLRILVMAYFYARSSRPCCKGTRLVLHSQPDTPTYAGQRNRRRGPLHLLPAIPLPLPRVSFLRLKAHVPSPNGDAYPFRRRMCRRDPVPRRSTTRCATSPFQDKRDARRPLQRHVALRVPEVTIHRPTRCLRRLQPLSLQRHPRLRALLLHLRVRQITGLLRISHALLRQNGCFHPLRTVASVPTLCRRR